MMELDHPQNCSSPTPLPPFPLLGPPLSLRHPSPLTYSPKNRSTHPPINCPRTSTLNVFTAGTSAPKLDKAISILSFHISPEPHNHPLPPPLFPKPIPTTYSRWVGDKNRFLARTGHDFCHRPSSPSGVVRVKLAKRTLELQNIIILCAWIAKIFRIVHFKEPVEGFLMIQTS